MGRRNTAKTGDKGIYRKARQLQAEREAQEEAKDDSDDDAVYSKVDQFYNRQGEKDYLALHQATTGRAAAQEDSNDDDSIQQKEAVMNLGGGDVSSSSEEEEEEPDDGDDESSSDNEDAKRPAADDSSSSSEEEEEPESNVRSWGRKKSVYYHGNSADLEVDGSDAEEDAFDEEEAAKQVAAARLQDMTEEDFVLSDDSEEEDDDKDKTPTMKKSKTTTTTTTKSADDEATPLQYQRRQASAWTRREQEAFLKQEHSEFLPLVHHFSDAVQDYAQRTNVVVQALYETQNEEAKDTDAPNKDTPNKAAVNDDEAQEEEDNAKAVGATVDGERYLLSRALVQSSSALNLALYLLLKSDYAAQQNHGDALGTTDDNIMQSHPVLDHLRKLDQKAEQIEKAVTPVSSALQNQMNNLIKASALLASGEAVDDDSAESSSKNEATDEESSKEGAESENDDAGSTNADPVVDKGKSTGLDLKPMAASSSSSSEDSDEDSDLERAKASKALRNETKFGLRPNDFQPKNVDSAKSRKRQRRAAPDFGENMHEEEATAGPEKRLATTVNALEQRRAAGKTKAEKSNRSMADDLDALPGDDEENELRKGLALMEAELGKDSEEDDDENNSAPDPELDDDGDDDEFYDRMEAKNRDKKRQRKQAHEVAPKFPRAEETVGADEPRAINRTIMVNRGLVPHRKKLNRNPRVKKREQYRRAQIRRRGAVRAMKDPILGVNYGGEETGIKSNLRRSRNLS